MRRYNRWIVLFALLAAASCQSASPQPIVPGPLGVGTPIPPGGAALSVVADPQGAQISVDGRAVGNSPLDLTLAAGAHRMQISAPGYAPVTEAITLTAGEQGIYSPSLADITPPAVTLGANPRQVPYLGRSQVRAAATDNRDVAGIQLLVDGQVVAEAEGGELTLDLQPADIPDLAAGNTYTVTARALDEAGNTGQATLALQVMPEPTASTVRATPAKTAPVAQATAGKPAPSAPPAAPSASAPTAAAPAAPAPTVTPPPALPTALAAPAGSTTYQVTTISIPTYPYTRYLRTVTDPKLGNYPVLVLDQAAYQAAHPQPVPTNYTLVILENRYLRLSILPDLGGRIYECVFKPTGNNEFYQNPVIKPTTWGPPSPAYPAGANWWLAAGGLEWGFPVEEHGYEWGKAWGYDYMQGDDGSATVTVLTGDYRRPYVAVAITLPPDSVAFKIEPTIVNPTAAPFRYKWWDNAMLAPGPANKPGPDLRFIIPGSQVTVHSTGDASLPKPDQPMAWPTYGGRDMSRLGNWKGWLGFFARPAAQAGFSAIYDTAANEGMVHVFPPDVVRGVKGFAAGYSEVLDWHNWTDDGSGYVELHGGLAPTFNDWNELAAGGEAYWEELWYPAFGIGGLVYASAGGAVNVSRAGSGVQVGVFPAHAVRGRLEISLPGAAATTRQVQIAPDKPFNETIAAAAGQGDASITLTDDQGQVVIQYRGALK